MPAVYDPEQIKDREQNPETEPGGQSSEIAGPQHENQVGRGYNPEAKPSESLRGKLFVVHRRRTIAGGGIIGTIIGLMFLFSTLSGPFQFIHIAQLLQQFHFSAQQDAADSRFTKLARYIHNKNTPQNTRLGYFANKYANGVEDNLNKSGIETAYTERFGFFDGYVIDPATFADGKFADDRAGLKAYLNEAYGVNPTEVGGKIAVKSQGVDVFGRKQRGLMREMLRTAGYSKISAAIQARIMGKRAGITWHPIKKLDQKILKTADERLAKWRENRTQNIENGASPADYPTEDKSSKEGKANAKEASGQTQGTAAEAQQAGEAAKTGNPAAIESFQKSIHFKLTTGAAAAAGVLCLAKGVANDADNVKQAQVVLPLIRMGMEAVTVGNQVMNGNDVSLEQLGFYSKQLNDEQTGSWTSARSVQAELGQKQTGPEADNTLKSINSGTPFDFLNTTQPLASILGGVCSTAGSIAQTVIGFFGGPVYLLAGTVISAVVVPQVEGPLANWLAGQAINPNATGAAYGNDINYGARLAANDQAIAAGGRELTSQESLALKTVESNTAKSDFNSQSLAYKLLNPYDSKSVISQVIDRSSTDTNQNVSKVASAFLNIPHVLASLPKPFSRMAGAASSTNYDYGFSQYGFSQDELNNDSIKNPYDNANIVVNSILPGPNGASYIKKIHDCFGVAIDPSSNYDVNASDNGVPKYKDISGNGCNDGSQDWLRIRFYIFDTQVADSMSCYEGDDQSCSNVDFESPPSTDNTQQPPAASGDAQQLAQQILANKNIDVSAGRLVQQDLQNTAAGQPGTAGAPVSASILRLIATIGQNHTLRITALESGGTGHAPNSQHYTGDAVDFDLLDGKVLTGRDPASVIIINIATHVLPNGSRFGQSGCGPQVKLPLGFSEVVDTCNHLHVDVPDGTP